LETRIGEALLKGFKHSEETKKKISESKKGQLPWITGRHHTEEARQKMSDAKMGSIPWNRGRECPEISQGRLELKEKLGYLNSPEAREKMPRSHLGRYTGAEHSNWKGGWKKYRGSDWSEQRKKARIRDNCVCQCCDATENGKEHDVHHWISYKLCKSNGLGNLVLLCPVCHLYIENRFRIDFPITWNGEWKHE